LALVLRASFLDQSTRLRRSRGRCHGPHGPIRPVPTNPSAIVGACWLAFFVAWAILAMIYGGSRRRSSTGAALGLRLLLLAGAYLAVRYGDSVRLFGAATYGVALTGAILCVVGLVFAVWARVTLGRSWGMPMTLHDDPELVTSGPYRYVRHPIYTGLSAMLLGTSLVYPLAAVPCLLTVAYSLFAARREERDMEQRFPADYPEYKARSRFLVPFLF
jgi:isoprenylcysteine carboxyl methyltransferase (ICMT) family protein YpbQ